MRMESKKCMNVVCGASTSVEWKKGWPLRSGEFAVLCDKCGSAYEQSHFCDIFHSNDSGWRECTSCGKRLHCGCIASTLLLELLDSGGVNCISCAKLSGLRPMLSDGKPNECSMSNSHHGELRSTSLDGDGVDKRNPIQLGNNADDSDVRNLLRPHCDGINGGQLKQEELLPFAGEIGKSLSLSCKSLNGGALVKNLDTPKARMMEKHYDNSLAQTSLSIALGAPVPGASCDARDHNSTTSPSQHIPRSRHLLPKPPKLALASSLEGNAGVASQMRVARPPAEGRGRNQLLPRYWPRITDQELQQISGDSNSIIVPLFEKVLSASDAGRIGRLVLPKACAEAYFPPISQPEGLPLRIQDVKGKEWVFQFRFWPNNNSRMYVLEGVTPCIQSMQLQAGDTVTFSRRDPEGKLVMGFRKASTSIVMQDPQVSSFSNGSQTSETLISGGFENLPIISGYSSLLQSLKGSTDPQLNALSKHFNSASSDVSWQTTEKDGGDPREAFLISSAFGHDKKRARNIGSRSKRLLIDGLDALELKLTWDEVQDLLRPPPSVKPSVVMVEDHAFEEYEEPPVFGKTSVFMVRSAGGLEQWTQCDNCAKWRRLPADTLLPPKWTCADNCLDQSRSSCSAPDELTPRELENLLRLTKEFKKRRLAVKYGPASEHESSGLDALANAAILGDTVGEPGTASVATTTKHPRHRPGCSCIVCIQPPSGKGKHKPTCNCNVCMTVKRRFKTLMMRKKKRQSEREAEIAQRNRQIWGPKDEADMDSSSRHLSPHLDSSENEGRNPVELDSHSQIQSANDLAEMGKGQIDLNCQPDREEDHQTNTSHVSMMNLLRVASQPLETYLKQNGLTSLLSEQQATSACVQQQITVETEGLLPEDVSTTSGAQEKVSETDGAVESAEDQNQTETN